MSEQDKGTLNGSRPMAGCAVLLDRLPPVWRFDRRGEQPRESEIPPQVMAKY